ncbi:MAG: amidophosphoribosyltransferase [Defluviitaleaceae bacterium]|nr:amidophosphoribosyltransferase [Defluviitaleaceae bacterium]
MKNIKEECGIFGIYDTGMSVAKTTYYALSALQHRGQEACGIAVNLNRDIFYHKDVGLVGDVFTDDILNSLQGTMAVGHVRYSTAGGGGRENAQPLVFGYRKGQLAIAHNGNLRNAKELKHEYQVTNGSIFQTTSDTEVIAYTIAKARAESTSIQEAVCKAMNVLKGSYSLVIMSPQKLIAAKDPWGLRPLCMGQKGSSIVFASESCAFDTIGAKFIRELEPGEIVVVEKGNVTSIKEHCGKEKSSLCIFEYIYFARPDSVIYNQSVYDARVTAGKILAKDHPALADLVIGVPDSGLAAAVGFAYESKIPYTEGFIKNRYVARTFIKPTQEEREIAVRMKLNPLKINVEGKRIIMVDDSIVRGTTSKRIVTLLKEAGAKEVHVRLSSPLFLHPCYYGTDIPSKEELIANTHTVEQIREYIGADSLGFLDSEKLESIAPNAECGFCTACFDGSYVI